MRVERSRRKKGGKSFLQYERKKREEKGKAPLVANDTIGKRLSET